MRWFHSRMFWGLLFIIAGALLMLQELTRLPFGNLFWAAVLGFVGVSILSLYVGNRNAWWVLIPGVILITLALNNLLEVLLPSFAETWSGPLVLAGIGASFFLIYLTNRPFWWAIIPGGVMITLAVVAGLSSFLRPEASGGIFFLGLGATFGLLAILPNSEGQLGWAWIPAVVLVALGLIITSVSSQYVNLLWPAVLIAAGLFMVFRAFSRRRQEEDHGN